jgi:hypothetical protein
MSCLARAASVMVPRRADEALPAQFLNPRIKQCFRRTAAFEIMKLVLVVCQPSTGALDSVAVGNAVEGDGHAQFWWVISKGTNSAWDRGARQISSGHAIFCSQSS